MTYFGHIIIILKNKTDALYIMYILFFGFINIFGEYCDYFNGSHVHTKWTRIKIYI